MRSPTEEENKLWRQFVERIAKDVLYGDTRLVKICVAMYELSTSWTGGKADLQAAYQRIHGKNDPDFVERLDSEKTKIFSGFIEFIEADTNLKNKCTKKCRDGYEKLCHSVKGKTEGLFKILRFIYEDRLLPQYISSADSKEDASASAEEINTDKLGDILHSIFGISSTEDTSTNPFLLKQNHQFNWSDICDRLLKYTGKDRLTTAALAGNLTLEGMHVPLGLVKREKKEELNRPDPNILPEMGSQLYREQNEQERIVPVSYDEFIASLLKADKATAIIGEPGAGKTTLLQKVAFAVMGQSPVVIWIDLGALAGQKLKDYIEQTWLLNAAETAGTNLEVIKQDFARQKQDGNVWLLLDGVDEMDSDRGNPLSVIAKDLQEMWFAKVKVVLTCRLNVWDADKNALIDFHVYRNLDFEPEQVNEFIDRWFRFKSLDNADSDGELLKQSLQASGKERIRDLVRNPLRLMLLCRTWDRGARKLPETKAGLYEELVKSHYLWKDGDVSKRFEISISDQEKLHKSLGKLAKDAIALNQSRFRLREKFIKKYLGDYFEVACNLGWLNRIGLARKEETNSHEPVYAFLHPTFQEYFAACEIANWRFFLPTSLNELEGDDYPIFDAKWREVILLWFGRDDIDKESKEKFIEALIAFKDGCGDFSAIREIRKGFYEFRAYCLAAICLAEFEDCRNAESITEEILEYILIFSEINPSKMDERNHISEHLEYVLISGNHNLMIKKLYQIINS